jgi:nucleoid-associated protein YgaU
MKRGITGILVLTLVAIILTLPGCTSIQDHWTIPDDLPLTAGIPAEEAPRSGPIGQDSAQEARLQREEAARREAEAREDARRQEEAARREAEAQEEARRQEEVRQLLEDLEASHRRAEAEERARQEAESRRSSGGQADAGLKPRYYIVRAGDTFNSIAANPLVYSNRNEWYTLYQANRDKLGNPDNPDLLAPGTVIEIPSIVGEIREGTY